MGCCSAPNCSNSSEKNFRMFRFPSDPERRNKWITNCRREGWTPGPNAQLCSLHFTNDQFEWNSSAQCIGLKPSSVPTTFNVTSFPENKLLNNTEIKKEPPANAKAKNKHSCFSDLFSNRKSSNTAESHHKVVSMSSEECLSDEVQEEENDNVGQWNVFNVPSVIEDKSDESTDFMQTCSQRWEELEFDGPARINNEIPAVTYVLGSSSSSKCKRKLQLADRARIDEELDEQEVLVLRARRKMLEVENEMANKKIKELEMQELTITKENNSMQREVQLFLKHNQGMNTVIFELQKHNNTLIKRLAELQQERTVFCEKIKDFETIYGDIASMIKLSSKKKLLINKIRKMTKVESVTLIDLTENDVD